MSAPEPTAEHVDAVERAIRPFIEGAPCHMTERGPLVVSGIPRCYATPIIDRVTDALLTSTDPAVHAAMLDALVRAGVLTEDTAPGFHRADGSVLVRYDLEGTHEFEARRLVTPWEVAP